MKSASDKARALVARIEAGDREAETNMVESYARGVRLMLLKRVANPHLANDLLQDTFIVAIRRLRAGELRKPESLAAFLQQTAVLICANHFRKEERYVGKTAEVISTLQPHWDYKGKFVDEEKIRTALGDALGRLAVSRDREILRRFYLADQDKQQICHALDLSSKHFDRVLYRARQRMRKVLTQRPEIKAMMLGRLSDG